MIREAKAVDVPQLIELLRRGYQRSRYAGMGDIAEKPTEQLLLGMILKSGIKALDGTLCNVAEVAGHIVGMHFAAKERVKLIGTKFMASDAFFYVEPGCGMAAYGLLDRFFDWAGADPRVIEIQSGTDDTIQDWRLTASLYEKYGFEQSGAILRRSTKRAA